MGAGCLGAWAPPGAGLADPFPRGGCEAGAGGTAGGRSRLALLFPPSRGPGRPALPRSAPARYLDAPAARDPGIPQNSRSTSTPGARALAGSLPHDPWALTWHHPLPCRVRIPRSTSTLLPVVPPGSCSARSTGGHHSRNASRLTPRIQPSGINVLHAHWTKRMRSRTRMRGGRVSLGGHFTMRPRTIPTRDFPPSRVPGLLGGGTSGRAP